MALSQSELMRLLELLRSADGIELICAITERMVNVIWYRSYDNASNPKTYNGDLQLTGDDWTLWSERLITVRDGKPNAQFRFQGQLTDWDASSNDDRVMHRDDYIDVVKEGEGEHTIDGCPDGCYWGESKITSPGEDFRVHRVPGGLGPVSEVLVESA